MSHWFIPFLYPQIWDLDYFQIPKFGGFVSTISFSEICTRKPRATSENEENDALITIFFQQMKNYCYPLLFLVLEAL